MLLLNIIIIMQLSGLANSIGHFYFEIPFACLKLRPCESENELAHVGTTAFMFDGNQAFLGS